MHISEILLILVVALLVIKPEKLPGVAYTLGKWLKWVREATTEIKHAIEKPLTSAPAAKKPEEISHE